MELLEEIVRPRLGSLQGLSRPRRRLRDGDDSTAHFASRVRKLHGVDVSEEMLVHARRTVPEADFSWYDGGKLPFADQSFDVVVAVCVLHHIPVSKQFKMVSEIGPCDHGSRVSWRSSSTTRQSAHPPRREHM